MTSHKKKKKNQWRFAWVGHAQRHEETAQGVLAGIIQGKRGRANLICLIFIKTTSNKTWGWASLRTSVEHHAYTDVAI